MSVTRYVWKLLITPKALLVEEKEEKEKEKEARKKSRIFTRGEEKKSQHLYSEWKAFKNHSARSNSGDHFSFLLFS